jgi:hypothetical protein
VFRATRITRITLNTLLSGLLRLRDDDNDDGDDDDDGACGCAAVLSVSLGFVCLGEMLSTVANTANTDGFRHNLQWYASIEFAASSVVPAQLKWNQHSHCEH